MQYSQRFIGLLLAGVSVIALVPAALAQDSVPLDTIVVSDESGAGAKEVETDVQVTEEDIERRNPQTLRQLFQTEPSVQVTGGSTATQKIFVNGVEQSKLNVQVDGARQRNSVWHHNGDFGIDPYFLKEVEVDAGVAPADAGPGALGGSVRLQTKDAKDMLLPGRTWGGTVRGSYDTDSETFTSTTAAYRVHQGFEVLGILKRSEGQDYTNGDGITEPGTANDLWNGLAKFGYESEAGHRFMLSTEYYRDAGMRRLRANLNLLSMPLFNYSLAERWTTTFRYTTTQPTDTYDPEVLLYYNRNRLQRPNRNGYAGPSGDFNADNGEVGGKIQNRFRFDWGTLTAGTDFSNNRTEIERFHFPNDVSERITDVGAYLQARIAATERLEISTGARADFQSYRAVDGQTFDNFGLSPNISAAFEIIDGIKLKSGYAYVFGGLEHPQTALYHARDYVYDRGLDPTWAHNANVGAEFSRGGVTVGANLFYTEMDNILAYDYTGPVAARVNGPELVTYGFDVFARYRSETTYLSLAYSHTKPEVDGLTALPNSSPNSANVVGDILTFDGSYTFRDWGVTVGGQAEIAFDFSDEDLRDAGFSDLDGYEVVNLFAEWQPPVEELAHVTLRGEVVNVFDEQYTRRGGYYQLPVRGIEPVYEQGRSFLVTATAKF
ncbi:hemoglobin/transferrin/lactoferrin receptor protein [Rhodobium orientis]|uniref:TonB-dependent receptor n=1 Tax=Rhodobium orientis TaxID=34017 RepID=A0A327JJF2_9HYPH|nr:TonB-dependent receptor [Rhodobium orientis]MBB4303209.1 hemoglobin/transferrin/lactoferrin receptor protein [Rhodobium orientis]MBK5951690.1 hypothetical protein [Rhodobium orientis]RAI25836.1 hypothetical protein CH339_16500 [Rhodobium orientis]